MFIIWDLWGVYSCEWDGLVLGGGGYFSDHDVLSISFSGGFEYILM